MKSSAMRIGVVLLGGLPILASAGGLCAQATLPATAPTTTVSQLPSANPAVQPGHVDIQWDGRLLTVSAHGNSLPDVFAAVAARAGIRVTGAAPMDRIYGTFGPAPLVVVLADLVGGLSVNMLFVDPTGGRPAQLTFTPRTGGVTPPDAAQQRQPQQYAQQPPPGLPPGQPAGAEPAGSAFPADPGPAGTPAQTGDNGSNPSSPNGVKTPQEIFEQLQRLRANPGAH